MSQRSGLRIHPTADISDGAIIWEVSPVLADGRHVLHGYKAVVARLVISGVGQGQVKDEADV